MKYVSLDIRIGRAVLSAMTQNRVAFHQALAETMFKETVVERLGVRHSSPFDYDRVAIEPEHIRAIVELSLADASVTPNTPCDAIFYDFTANPFDLIREPVLLHLAAEIEHLSVKGGCLAHVVLLPRLPGAKAASIARFDSISSASPNAEILLIANDGNRYWKGPDDLTDQMEPPYDYPQRVAELFGSPQRSLREKLVRRLGHFRGSGVSGCRQYSYFLDASVTELLELLGAWWDRKSISATGIVYHSPSSPSLTAAVKAFAQPRGLVTVRSDDLHEDLLQNAAIPAGTYVLVVDVIESGDTLERLIETLGDVGFVAHSEAFSAIVKGNAPDIEVGATKVHGALSVPAEIKRPRCPQCEIKLPFTDDEGETFQRIRSFDMWHMATEAGWEVEPDVPIQGGYVYPMIPKFPAMLQEFGDWISFKMVEMLNSSPHPQSFFVIHPDEVSAIALSTKLRVRYDNRLAVVRVPRALIQKARSMNNDWARALGDEPVDQEWLQQLKSVASGAIARNPDVAEPSALVVDIFNASGSTFETLHALLTFFNVNAFAYFPMIDRDLRPAEVFPHAVKKLALYEWYGPRKLVEKANEAAL